MSKERIKIIVTNWENGHVNTCDVDWLIEQAKQVQELEDAIKEKALTVQMKEYIYMGPDESVSLKVLRQLDKVKAQNKRYRERIEKLEAKNWELIEENQELKEQINQHIRFLDENHKGWENNWNFNALLNEKEKLHAENEELAVAYNNVQKEIYILKNKLESHRNTLKFYADETNYDAQYRLEIMRDSGDRARRELIN